jgi:ABC-type antimicrobial peptide transport system permease subunit
MDNNNFYSGLSFKAALYTIATFVISYLLIYKIIVIIFPDGILISLIISLIYIVLYCYLSIMKMIKRNTDIILKLYNQINNNTKEH